MNLKTKTILTSDDLVTFGWPMLLVPLVIKVIRNNYVLILEKK